MLTHVRQQYLMVPRFILSLLYIHICHCKISGTQMAPELCYPSIGSLLQFSHCLPLSTCLSHSLYGCSRHEQVVQILSSADWMTVMWKQGQYNYKDPFSLSAQAWPNKSMSFSYFYVNRENIISLFRHSPSLDGFGLCIFILLQITEWKGSVQEIQHIFCGIGYFFSCRLLQQHQLGKKGRCSGELTDPLLPQLLST